MQRVGFSRLGTENQLGCRLVSAESLSEIPVSAAEETQLLTQIHADFGDSRGFSGGAVACTRECLILPEDRRPSRKSASFCMSSCSWAGPFDKTRIRQR